MATARDIQLRQLMLHEHRTGNDEKTACKKICEKLGPNSITISKVKYWYKRFQSGDTSIFNKSSYFHRLKNASQQKKGENVLMQFKDKRLGGLVTKLDGRNFIFSKGYATNAKEQFILVDLFHGAVRPLTIADSCIKKKMYYRRIEMIDPLHFLALEFFSERLILYKLNYLEWKVEVVHSLRIKEMKHGDFVVDSLDKRQFILTLENNFCLGCVDESDRLVIGGQKTLDLDGFDFKELKNNRLFDILNLKTNIDGTLSCEICEYNLNELEVKSNKVPMSLPDGTNINDIQGTCYVYLGNCLYVASKNEDNEFRVLKLDMQSLEWADTGAKVPHPITELFIDEEEILTVRTGEKKSGLVEFYRFALRTPDTLKNLVWFSIVRESKFGENDVYGQVITRLPLNDELRCRLLAQ